MPICTMLYAANWSLNHPPPADLQSHLGVPHSSDETALSTPNNHSLQGLRTLGISFVDPAGLSSLASLSCLRHLILDCPEGADVAGVQAMLLSQQQQDIPGGCLSRLRGLWLSDSLLTSGSDLLVWQHSLQQAGAACVCVRPANSDWFWKTGFPIGSCLDHSNPCEWWFVTPWTLL